MISASGQGVWLYCCAALLFHYLQIRLKVFWAMHPVGEEHDCSLAGCKGVVFEHEERQGLECKGDLGAGDCSRAWVALELEGGHVKVAQVDLRRPQLHLHSAF